MDKERVKVIFRLVFSGFIGFWVFVKRDNFVWLLGFLLMCMVLLVNLMCSVCVLNLVMYGMVILCVIVNDVFVIFFFFVIKI